MTYQPSPQQIVDVVVRGLHAQGFIQCRDAEGRLASRAGGRKCPLGIIRAAIGAEPEFSDLVLELMQAHDLGRTPQEMTDEIRAVVEKHGLEFPKLG